MSTTNLQMNDKLSNYLTPHQYNKIIKYWRCINQTSEQLKNCPVKYRYLSDVSDSEDEDIIRHNDRLDRYLEKLRGRLNYYEREYEVYVNSIGFELNNPTYDEHLFNLLNNGIMLD